MKCSSDGRREACEEGECGGVGGREADELLELVEGTDRGAGAGRVP